MTKFIAKKCFACGADFSTQSPVTLSCSKRCAWVLRNKRVEKTNESADSWFWNKCHKSSNNECWEWLASTKNGYGIVSRYNNKPYEYAHRVSFFLHNGNYPYGVTRHTCDNKICINPHHLLEGSSADNSRDAKERGLTARGEKVSSAKLIEEQVRFILKSDLRNVEISKMFNITSAHVTQIRKRSIWRHVNVAN